MTQENHERLLAECSRIRAREGCKVAPGRIINQLIADHLNGAGAEHDQRQRKSAAIARSA